MNILTVCGNGIGSSIMLAMKIEEICKENDISANVESTDFNSAQGKKTDLIVTIKEFATQFEDKEVIVVRSFINKKKIIEDALDIIKKKAEELKK